MLPRYLAFSGDPGRKATFVSRLADHVAAGELHFDAATWDGAKGRPTGCTVHDPDIKVYEFETGYPAVLGAFLDFLHGQLQGCGEIFDISRAHGFAQAWLAATPTGADLTGVASRIVLAALADEARDNPGLAEPGPEIAAAFEVAQALHSLAAIGDMPDRAAWSAARAEAVAATDAASNKEARTVGALVEAVCWNPLSSRSLLVDLVRPWAQVRYFREIRASGWTQEDQSAADALLQGLWEEFAPQREAGELVDFPALFTDRDPELQRRYADQLHVGQTAYHAAMWAMGQIALRTLQEAPVPARAP